MIRWRDSAVWSAECGVRNESRSEFRTLHHERCRAMNPTWFMVPNLAPRRVQGHEPYVVHGSEFPMGLS